MLAPKGNPYETAYHWDSRGPYEDFGYLYPARLVSRYLRLGNRVMDLGCGDGKLTACLAAAARSKGCRVVGVDYQGTAISYAREKTAGLNLDNLEFEQVDFRMPFAGGLYDWVVLFDVIEHIHATDVPDLLRGIREHLDVGGRVVLTTPNRRSIRNRIHGFELNSKKHFVEYSAGELKEACVAIEGFDLEWLKGIYVPLPLRSLRRPVFRGIWGKWYRLSEALPSVCNKLAICLVRK